MRCWSAAWLLTSMAAKVQPASAMRRRNPLRAMGWGVVCSAAVDSVSTILATVESSPARSPMARAMLYSSVATVVLPLVPVTPTSESSSEGSPKKREAIRPRASRLSATVMRRTSEVSAVPEKSSATITAAPARAAPAIKRWPSASQPRTATNTPPGTTARESSVIPDTVSGTAPSVASGAMASSRAAVSMLPVAELWVNDGVVIGVGFQFRFLRLRCTRVPGEAVVPGAGDWLSTNPAPRNTTW